MSGVPHRLLTVAGLCLAWQLVGPTSAQADPVEYVKVCSLYGAGYFYIPGTDVCQNANQISANEYSLSSFQSTAFQGIAASTAMVSPFMPSAANYAVSVHWGNFEGSNAVGFSGLMRVNNSNFFLSGGVGTGFEGGGASVERAGFMFAW